MTKRAPEELAEELLFEADGHVSETVLACMADGELALVPARALDHVDACEVCVTRLGAAALLSLGVGEDLRAVDLAAITTPAAERAHTNVVSLRPAAIDPAKGAPVSRRRRPLPARAIAAALLVAAITAAPTWIAALSSWKTLLPTAVRSISMVARVLVMAVRGSPLAVGNTAIVMRWIAAAIFIVVGWTVARAMSRKQSLAGGVR